MFREAYNRLGQVADRQKQYYDRTDGCFLQHGKWAGTPSYSSSELAHRQSGRYCPRWFSNILHSFLILETNVCN